MSPCNRIYIQDVTPPVVNCKGGSYSIDQTIKASSNEGGLIYLVLSSQKISSYDDLLNCSKSYGLSCSENTEVSFVVSKMLPYEFQVGDTCVFYSIDEKENLSQVSECQVVFVAGTYNIIYNTNGGNFDSDKITTYTYGTEFVLPTNLSKNGYTFYGWYANSSFTGSRVTKISKTEYGNKIYYANWTPNTYTITYELIDSVYTERYTYGYSYTLLSGISKTHYSFGGWYTNADLSGNSVSRLSATAMGDTTFYAKWIPDTYAVTLNTNYGKINSGSITSYTYTEGATLPTDVTMNGYTFKGWYDNSNLLGSAVTEISGTEYGAKTYWAKWSVATYDITLKVDGGTINSGLVKKYTYGTGAILPVDVTKSGYEFGGWYSDELFETNAVETISDEDFGNKVFYAKWEKVSEGIDNIGLKEILEGEDNSAYSIYTQIQEGSLEIGAGKGQISEEMYADFKETWEAAQVIFYDKNANQFEIDSVSEVLKTIIEEITKVASEQVSEEIVVKPLSNINVMLGSPTVSIKLSNYFSIAGGNTISYMGASNNSSVAKARVSNDTIYIMPQQHGKAEITVMANASNGESQVVTFIVQVDEPVVVEFLKIEDITIQFGESIDQISLNDYFKVISGTADLTYQVKSSNIGVVYPVVLGDDLGLVVYGAGSATIMVTAQCADTVVTGQFVVTINKQEETTNCDMKIYPIVTDNQCPGDENGNIEIIVMGGMEPYTYKWSNGRTSQDLHNLASGEYEVLITDSLLCSVTKTFKVAAPDSLLLETKVTAPQCGESNGSVSVEVVGGTAPYSYKWQTHDNTYTTASIENISAGNCLLTITDSKGCEIKQSIVVVDEGAPFVQIEEVHETKCNENTGVILLNVSGGEEPYSYSWNDGKEVKNRFYLSAGDYTVEINDAKGCRTMLTATVPMKTFKQPELALVTNSQESDVNLIVWQKEETDLIDHYTIYRETSAANQYEKIGETKYDEISIFVDNEVDVKEQAWRYKISAGNACGESPMSKGHKTIHLQKNVGISGEVNLIWDAYEGVNYNTYLIYRKVGVFVELLKEVSANNVRYTDKKPLLGTRSYFVAIKLIDTIDITKPMKAESGPFVIAISNIAEVENEDEQPSDTTETALESVSGVLPSVSVQGMNIIVRDANGSSIEIYDITGRGIETRSNVQNAEEQIPMKAKGVYLVFVGKQAFEVLIK